MLVAVPAQAQVGAAPAANTLGVVAGLNVNMPRFDPSVDQVFQDVFGFDSGESKGKMGFAAGVSFDRALTSNLNLRVQGLFSQVGLSFSGEVSEVLLASTAGATPAGINGGSTFSVENVITLNQLVIDALVGIPMGADSRANILAGLSFAFNLSQKETFKTVLDGVEEEENVEGEDQTDIKDNNVALAFGAEFRAAARFWIGVLYRLGLTNLDNSSDEPDALFKSVKLSTLFVFVRISFGG
jgi:hypothetical protein